MFVEKYKERVIMSNQLDNYINLEEAATYLGVKPATIRTWIKTKEFPAHRVGKLWKFKRSEIDDWVNSDKSTN